MEFSFQITERDYAQAYRMALKSKRTGVVKTLLFWAFLVICLVLVFTVVQKRSQPPANSESETYTAQDAPPAPAGRSLLINVGPFLVIVVIWGSIVYSTNYGTRRLYRKDTNLHGITTVTFDRLSFASRSTSGASMQCPWSTFQHWRETGGIVLLAYPNGTFAILNVAGLSDSERQELRGILAEVLPEKK